MTISKRCGIVLLVGAIGYFGLELGERLSVPGIHSFVSSGASDCWASANARQCCGGRATDSPAMRCWSVLLLRRFITELTYDRLYKP